MNPIYTPSFDCRGMSLLALALLIVPAANAEDATVAPSVNAFFQTYCIGCHGPKKQQGDFRVDALKIAANASDAENWQLVLDNLQLGEMPPKDAKQPRQAEVEQVTTWIQNELSRAAAELKGTDGEVVLRRLNRAEYENTVADLFDVHGDFTAGFPEDLREHGFDNNGGALMLSAAQMQEYMKAADFILARAIAPATRPETKSKTFTLHDENLRAMDAAAKNLAMRLAKFDSLTPQEQANTLKAEEAAKANPDSHGYRFPVLENGALRPPKPTDGPHLDAVMTVQQYFSGQPQSHRHFNLNRPGWYRVKAVAYALKNDGKPVRLRFSAGRPLPGVLPKVESVFSFTDDQPREVGANYYLEPSDRVEFTIMDGAPHSQGRSMIDQPGPFIAIRSFSIEGPVYESWPAKGHRTLFGEIDPTQPTPEKAAEIAAHLAPKLFRRPVYDVAVEKYRALFAKFSKTMTSDEALRGMLAAMLVSPRFLYHEEPPSGPDAFAIASRISYFLWRSTPDNELLQAAADGSLLDATKRRAQAERMLADSRTERLLTDFTGQWLRVREVGVMKANAELYPEYDAELEAAMRAETEHFIAEMFQRDLPLSNLIDSHWTMLNERLAKHYRIDGVVGPDFRRVSLDKSKTVRGGLLTHASIHAVTSNGSTTSPVVRGTWVLEKFLGTPASPPPPDVPAIEPDIRGATTIKEQLAKHRDIASCASCHRKIDPPGFALENFDVIGGWRDHYRALIEPRPGARAKLTDGPPVDPADEWEGVGRFGSFHEFRELVKKREDLVVQNLTHQFATFALGRAPGFADRQPLKDIANKVLEKKSGMKSLVIDIVSSPVFTNP
jgi:mono/diheme cytochrome c family protein